MCSNNRTSAGPADGSSEHIAGRSIWLKINITALAFAIAEQRRPAVKPIALALRKEGIGCGLLFVRHHGLKPAYKN
jgi:hypothetical protein